MFDTDKFISLIHEWPALWEKSCREFSDKTCRDKAWVEIGKNLYADWDDDSSKEAKLKEMKIKWRNLKDSFMKYTNQGKSGDCAPKKKYIYADALDFLQNSVEKRDTSGNFTQDEVDDAEGDEVENSRKAPTRAKGVFPTTTDYILCTNNFPNIPTHSAPFNKTSRPSSTTSSQIAYKS